MRKYSGLKPAFILSRGDGNLSDQDAVDTSFADIARTTSGTEK